MPTNIPYGSPQAIVLQSVGLFAAKGPAERVVVQRAAEIPVHRIDAYVADDAAMLQGLEDTRGGRGRGAG